MSGLLHIAAEGGLKQFYARYPLWVEAPILQESSKLRNENRLEH